MATAGALQKSAVSASGTHQQMNVGLKVEPQFCPIDVNDPFDTVEWEVRSAEIKDENGSVFFEQTDCEIPAQWTGLDSGNPGYYTLQ